MLKSRLVGLAILGAAVVMSPPLQAADELMDEAKEMFKPIPTSIPEVKGNTITKAKIELGKMLFFDPRLSSSHLISCNTCHNVGMGGDDNLETSIGHGWAKGPRNAPTALNAVFNVAQFWDGRAEDLKAQAKGPVQAGVEMNNTPSQVVKTLKSMPGYIDAFKAAFPGVADPITFDNMAIAIEAFEATLTTPGSRFDQYLEGQTAAINAEEKEGLRLFMDKGCVACHAGINLGGQEYYPFGLIEKPGADILPVGDKGRFAVTETADDSYVFRAGPLRNIELTAPYFHSGKVWSLETAVAIMGESQLGEILNPKEVKAITAFLKTLTGDQPMVTYPVLPVSTHATPLPEAMVAK